MSLRAPAHDSGSGWIANLLLYGLRPCCATRTFTNYTPSAVDGAFQDPALVGFEDLQVWRQAHELAVEVYKLARQFPPDERFRYTDQICRAATSVPTTVAEGTGRYGKRDFKHFLYIARGSLAETKYLLLLGKDLGFVTHEDYNHLRDRCDNVGKLPNGLINSLKKDKE